MAAYEDTGATPELLKSIDEEYTSMAKELSVLRQQNRWIPVSDALPAPEQEVLIITERDIITTAIYEDGTITDEDSCWFWTDMDFDYDEVFNSEVDKKVLAWMPLPEPYKE